MKINPRVAAAAIAAACAIAAPIVARWEGGRNEPYRDVVGVLTVCFGSTSGIERRRYTDEECETLLGKDLRRHAEEVARCTPMIFDKPKLAAAVTSFSYNVGGSAYCKSSAARHFRAGNYRAGCEALSKYVYAKGRKLRGLELRRQDEVRLCLEGIA